MLVIGIPVLLLALQLFGIQSIYMGAGTTNFAVFIAFALIYPSADVFFGLTARWLAIILLALNSLQVLAASAWAMLAVLWWGVRDCLHVDEVVWSTRLLGARIFGGG